MYGKNIYDELKKNSRNYSVDSLNESFINEKLKEASDGVYPSRSETCIFLSHKSEDKDRVTKIANYIKQCGVNVYLDIEDHELQQAFKDGNHHKITQYIDLGISYSSHVMTLVSDKTKDSWWVPYEVGIGKSRNKELSTLKLKEVRDLPSFLQITKQLKTIGDLNNYLQKVNKDIRFSSSGQVHPLDDCVSTY